MLALSLKDTWIPVFSHISSPDTFQMGGTYVKILRKATKNMALKMPAGG